MAKIGIFGGTFDPIHVGHLRVAAEFADAFELDRVLMMVAATPPHRDTPTASPEDRLRMVQIAVRQFPKLEASDMELVRRGPSFTFDTVKEVSELAGSELVWMALGEDAYALISSWHRPEAILARTHLVVLTRPGYSVDLMASLPSDIANRYTFNGKIYVSQSGATIRTLQVSAVDVSSSMIRKAASEGRDIRDLVTADVLKYIQKRGLYSHP